VGREGNYGGIVEEGSGLNSWCDSSGHMNDIPRKLLAFKANHIGKEKFINFNKKLVLSREEENAWEYNGVGERV
jgi:hypothetical protein